MIDLNYFERLWYLIWFDSSIEIMIWAPLARAVAVSWGTERKAITLIAREGDLGVGVIVQVVLVVVVVVEVVVKHSSSSLEFLVDCIFGRRKRT